MSASREGSALVRQQILVSGLGGQGVLFLTRLLADAAIRRGVPVLTSETHGMAQRGGVVVSHLKVGDFFSPLIRASRADGLILLSEENLAAHRGFLRPGGWMVVNGRSTPEGPRAHLLDADGLAREAGNPQGANLVLLGFALRRLGTVGGGGGLYCSAGDVRAALEARVGTAEHLLGASLAALDLGFRRGTGDHCPPC